MKNSKELDRALNAYHRAYYLAMKIVEKHEFSKSTIERERSARATVGFIVAKRERDARRLMNC